MNNEIAAALARGGVIDITTTGRKSGRKRRIEINFSQLSGRYFITGRPGRPRDWLANVSSDPSFTVHLKHGVSADLPATARVISDDEERSDVLYRILVESWGNPTAKADHILPRWVAGAPLIEFTLA